MKKILLALISLLLCANVYATESWVDGYALDSFEITDWAGMGEPSVSASGQARVYFDSTANDLMLSENGGAYSPFVTDVEVSGDYLKLNQSTPQTVTASPIFDWGTATRIPFYSDTKTLTDDSSLAYDLTNKRLLLTSDTGATTLDVYNVSGAGTTIYANGGTGIVGRFERNVNTSILPMMYLFQNHAGDSNDILLIRNDGTGNFLNLTNSADVTKLSIDASGNLTTTGTGTFDEIFLGDDTAADQTILTVNEGSGVNRPYLLWDEEIYGLPISGFIFKQLGEDANLATISSSAGATLVAWSEAASQASGLVLGGGSPNVLTDGKWWGLNYDGDIDDSLVLSHYVSSVMSEDIFKISSSVNPTYTFTGYITADTAQKTFALQLSDTDDLIHWTREDSNVLGTVFDMPLDVTTTPKSFSIGSGFIIASGIKGYVTETTDKFTGANTENAISIGMNMDLYRSGDIENYGTGCIDGSLAHRFYSNNSSVYKKASTSILTYIGGIYGGIDDGSNVNASGATLNSVGVGFYSDALFTGASTQGTHNHYNVLLTGILESQAHTVTSGTVRNIMLYAYDNATLGDMFVPKVGDENYVILDETAYPWAKRADNAKITLGAGDDASIYYDGTNLVIDPAEVGTGILDIKDGLKVGKTTAYWTTGEYDATGSGYGYIPTLTPTASVLGDFGVILASGIVIAGGVTATSTQLSLSPSTLGSSQVTLEYVYSSDTLWCDTAFQIYDTDDLTRAINFTIGESDITTNPYFRHYGVTTTPDPDETHYVQFQLDSATDYYTLTRDDTEVLGFKVDMPLVGFTELHSNGSTPIYNSIYNLYKTVADLGNEYNCMLSGNMILTSTSGEGDNTVPIGFILDTDVTGGYPNHIVSIVGRAGLNSTVASTIVGVEGKVYLNTAGSTGEGFFAMSHLNAADNTGSTAYGIVAASSALQGPGTGTSIGGIFTATGGNDNWDVFLNGSKSIAAWNNAFTATNEIQFIDTNLQIRPIDWCMIGGSSGIAPMTDGLALGNTSYEWGTAYINQIKSDTGTIDFDNENLTTTGNVIASLMISSATGVSATAANGVLTLLGLGDGYDENITFDFNLLENYVSIGSTSGANFFFNDKLIHLNQTDGGTLASLYGVTAASHTGFPENDGGFQNLVMLADDSAEATDYTFLLHLNLSANADYGSGLIVGIHGEGQRGVMVEQTSATNTGGTAYAFLSKDKGDTGDAPHYTAIVDDVEVFKVDHEGVISAFTGLESASSSALYNSIYNFERATTSNAFNASLYSNITQASGGGASALPIGIFGRATVTGGTMLHAIGVMGWEVADTVVGSYYGVEGKTDNEIAGSTTAGVLGSARGNIADNTGSTNYGGFFMATNDAGVGSGTNIGIQAYAKQGLYNWNAIFGEGTSSGDNALVTFNGYITDGAGTGSVHFNVDDTDDVFLINLTDAKIDGLRFKLRDTAGTAEVTVADSGNNRMAGIDSDGNIDAVGDITGAYIKTGGNEFLAHDVIRKTLDATDVSNGYVVFAWNKATTAKVVSISGVWLDESDANDNIYAIYQGATYDGTYIVANSTIASAFSLSWAEGDILTVYVVYEK